MINKHKPPSREKRRRDNARKRERLLRMTHALDPVREWGVYENGVPILHTSNVRRVLEALHMTNRWAVSPDGIRMTREQMIAHLNGVVDNTVRFAPSRVSSMVE